MERSLSCWTVSAEFLTGRSTEGLASGSAEVLAGCMAHLLAELLLRELALSLVILQQKKKRMVLRKVDGLLPASVHHFPLAGSVDRSPIARPD